MMRIIGTALLAAAAGAGFAWGAARLLGADAWMASLVSGLLLGAVVAGLMVQAQRRGRRTDNSLDPTPD